MSDEKKKSVVVDGKTVEPGLKVKLIDHMTHAQIAELVRKTREAKDGKAEG